MRGLPSREPATERDPRLRYVLLAAAILLVGLAGFVGFLAYPRLQTPAPVGVGTLVLAAGAGLAVFFSPCAFPLLLTLLVRDAGSDRRAAVRFASAFSIGIVSVLAALGALIAAGGRGLASSVTFTSGSGIALRTVVGVSLVFLGLIQLDVVPISFHSVERHTKRLSRWHAEVRRRRPMAGNVVFGASYLLIGFG